MVWCLGLVHVLNVDWKLLQKNVRNLLVGWRESWPDFDHCKCEANIRREQSNYLLASLYNAAIELSVSHVVKMGIANWRASFHPDSCVLNIE